MSIIITNGRPSGENESKQSGFGRKKLVDLPFFK